MEQYKHLVELFQNRIAAHTRTLASKQPVELYGPEAYILALGGKRLRPLLALIACDLFGSKPERALGSAICVELFHNFSLIHDDILDVAPLRRGQPTVHEKWNVNVAILSGDVMLVKAFQVLEEYGAMERASLHELFCKTAIEVCEGQQLDMNFEKLPNVSIADYLHMVSCKTAVLLGCSLKMGAINAGAEKTDQDHLYEFGKHLGIAFQLLDDYLDAFSGDAQKFGKQIGGDILCNKKTFLMLKAFELADKKQRELLDQALRETDQTKKVQNVLALYRELKIDRLCQNEADEQTNLAIAALDRVSTTAGKKEQLRAFALELLQRQN